LAKDAENAVYTLKKNFGIDASQHVPRNVRSLDLTVYHLIIALEKDAATLVRELGAPRSKVKLWKIRDPRDLGDYDRASLQIEKKVFRLKASKGDADQT
jgi:protein-tyrosine-phosphatase